MAFGGSIYASLDPIIAVQVAHILGGKYIVLDKSARINYLKPIRKTVYCESVISDELIIVDNWTGVDIRKESQDIAPYHQDSIQYYFTEKINVY